MLRFIQSQTHLAGIVVLVLFGLLYLLIGPVNHLMFRTYALDLGAYTHASWCYGHGILPDRSLFRADTDPMLADHFDLMLMLWSPLTWVFGEWTLLLVQISAVLFGALGVLRLTRSITGDAVISILAMSAMLGFFGVFTALSFDYHSNVVAAMLLPWWLLAHKQGHKTWSWVFLILMLVAKENMGIWLFAVCLASLALPFLREVRVRTLLFQAALSLVWSLVVIRLIMPWLDSSGEYHLANAFLPKDPMSAGLLDLLMPLIHDVNGAHPLGDRIKLEWYLVIFVSGGWALIRNWPYLVMSLPLIAQKMLHQDPAKWGLFDQYSVEFAVILPLAAFTWIARVPDLRWRHLAGGITLLLVLAGTFHALYLPEEHRDPMHGAHDRLRFWSMGHFRPVFDRDVASRLLSKVPDGAPVSTMPPLVPHLVEREYLYQFPLIGNSEFILLVRHAYPWPMTFEEYTQQIDWLMNSREWALVHEEAGFLLFARTSQG